jgi:hypothetical protein
VNIIVEMSDKGPALKMLADCRSLQKNKKAMTIYVVVIQGEKNEDTRKT